MSDGTPRNHPPQPEPGAPRSRGDVTDRAEVLRRVTHVYNLLRDGNSKREVRAFLAGNTEWGRTISDSTFQRYYGHACRWLETNAAKHRTLQLGKAIARYENWIRKALAQSPPKINEARKLQQRIDVLLGLEAPRTLGISATMQHSGSIEHEHKRAKPRTVEERVATIRDLVTKALAGDSSRPPTPAEQSARGNN